MVKNLVKKTSENFGKILAKVFILWYYKSRFKRRRVGMADEADSKSVVGNHVRVQVPLPAFDEMSETQNQGVLAFLFFEKVAYL